MFRDQYFQADEGYQIISWCPWTKVGRIGEASNPGPTQDPGLMHVSLVNITKLRKNSDEVFELFQELPGIVCIAETSADERAIKQTTKQADKQKLNFFALFPKARWQFLEADFRVGNHLQCLPDAMAGAAIMA